jgi:hypothetical protein
MDKLRLAQELDALSQKMSSVAEEMAKHEGDLYQRHSAELAGAAGMVWTWYVAMMEDIDGDE